MDERAESPLVNGSLSEVLAYHSSHIPERFWADWQYPDSGFLVLACFLVGVVVMRSGWASLSQLSANRAGGVAGSLWLVGLGLMALSAIGPGRSAIRPLIEQKLHLGVCFWPISAIWPRR